MQIPLEKLFPSATKEQIEALVHGKPVPPSPEYLENFIERSGTFSHPIPKISCIMVANDPKRIRLARQALKQFYDQTYVRKELIIVNTTDQAICEHYMSDVVEIRYNPATDEENTIGYLRNLGVEKATGDWIKIWDDDDIYDPLLLAYVVGCCRNTIRPYAFSWQMRIDLIRSVGCFIYDPDGIPSTAMIPRKLAKNIFPHKNAHSLREAWEHIKDESYTVINSSFPATCLHIAVYHGYNLSSLEDFMGVYSKPEYRNSMFMTPRELQYLQDRIERFGLRLEQVSYTDDTKLKIVSDNNRNDLPPLLENAPSKELGNSNSMQLSLFE